MEIKKSSSADLENHRLEYFLLGLVFVLAVLYAGLEHTSHAEDTSVTEELLDDMAEDMELMPALDQKDMIAATTAAAKPALTEKIKAVDNAVKTEDAISPNTSPLLLGDGEGAAEGSHVEEALPQTPPDAKEEDVLHIAEQYPEFPGGPVAFMKWLTKELHYPPLALQKKLQGRVLLSFIVNKDGSIANIKVEKSVDPLLDREALRVARRMPKWKPGLHNDKPCRSMVAIPIVFEL